MFADVVNSWLPSDAGPILRLLLQFLATIVTAWLLQQMGFLLVGRIQRWLVLKAAGSTHAVLRARTLRATGRNVVTTLVLVGSFFHVLELLGWDLRPLLVGASVMGAALSFGAQTLVRVLISGVFILIEDQYTEGEAVEVNGQAATVEDLTLRSTRLRDWQGRVVFVPNSEMKVVVNHSRGWHLAVVDLPLALNQDLGSVFEVAAAIVREVNAEPTLQPYLLEPMKVLGIERFGTGGAFVRLAAKTPPGAPGAEVSRAARRIAIARMYAAGLRAAGDPIFQAELPSAKPAGGDLNPLA
jgi:small conductance mechanosensitive channel